MTFLIFLIVLGVLIFIHELGHFLAAKKAGVRVDEFGFGYPPRALKIGKKWGTLFTLNWIPFGGFVKIFGEDYEEAENLKPKTESQNEKDLFKSFDSKLTALSFVEVSKKWQGIILAAGVIFNMIFAWLLFSFGFMVGLPTSLDNNFGGTVKDPHLTVIDIIPSSPAKNSGLKTGDKIIKISTKEGETLLDLNPENVSDFINKSSAEVLLEVGRAGEVLNFEIMPDTEIIKGRRLIGIDMDMVGILSLPPHKAFYEGGRTTFDITYLTVIGIAKLIGDAFKGEADISQVAGPVGIIRLVGDASRLGFIYLTTFTALISINLAIINLMPFPALDGGRIVFVIIESITKRNINPKIAHILNTIGFALLIILMLFITYRDILKLF